MLIDCATCIAPEHACRDCVVTVLLNQAPNPRPAAVDLDDAEQRALAELSAAGLVPPLRLVPVAQQPRKKATRRSMRGIA